MKTCDYSDGIFAHETSTSCRCGKTAICDANVGMICDGTKCSRQNDCLQTTHFFKPHLFYTTKHKNMC